MPRAAEAGYPDGGTRILACSTEYCSSCIYPLKGEGRMEVSRMLQVGVQILHPVASELKATMPSP